jgi:nucleotide-binding universal stress UspA family protein
MYKHILIPTDGSNLSEMAIRQGIRLAKAIGAQVTGITVFPPFHTLTIEPMMVTDTQAQYQEDCDALGEKYLRVVKEVAKVAGISCEVMRVMHDHPYQAIIEAAKGRKGVAALVLGSETTKVLTHTHIPVLVCR